MSKVAAIGALLIVMGAIAQSGPKFDVASIKPSPQPAGHVGIAADGARVDIGYWSILQLMVKAYRLQFYQVVGPEWLGRIRFDIQATLPHGAGQNEIPEMLQSLLAERFGLVMHADTKELRGFGLTLAKGGMKMKVAPPEPDVKEEVDIMDELSGSGEAFGGSMKLLPNGDMHLEFQKMPMRALAVLLSADLVAPVTDRTGLPGKYQFTLEFDPMTTGNQGFVRENSAGDLITAVTQLGLRLERQPVRCNVLVVDRVAQAPTAN